MSFSIVCTLSESYFTESYSFNDVRVTCLTYFYFPLFRFYRELETVAIFPLISVSYRVSSPLMVSYDKRTILRANCNRGNKVLNESEGRLDTPGRNSCRYIITLGEHEITLELARFIILMWFPRNGWRGKSFGTFLRHWIVIIAFASCRSYGTWLNVHKPHKIFSGSTHLRDKKRCECVLGHSTLD